MANKIQVNGVDINKRLAERLRQIADALDGGDLGPVMVDNLAHACSDSIICGVGYVRISEVDGQATVERLDPLEVTVVEKRQHPATT